MEIAYKKKEEIAFRLVVVGDVFSQDDIFFMRTQDFLSKATELSYNAVNLNNGGFFYFDDNDEVHPVDAQLVIS